MSKKELPPPLPPETRTVGQLVAETLKLYGDNLWRSLALGISVTVINQVSVGHETLFQVARARGGVAADGRVVHRRLGDRRRRAAPRERTWCAPSSSARSSSFRLPFCRSSSSFRPWRGSPSSVSSYRSSCWSVCRDRRRLPSSDRAGACRLHPCRSASLATLAILFGLVKLTARAPPPRPRRRRRACGPRRSETSSCRRSSSSAAPCSMSTRRPGSRDKLAPPTARGAPHADLPDAHDADAAGRPDAEGEPEPVARGEPRRGGARREGACTSGRRSASTTS